MLPSFKLTHSGGKYLSHGGFPLMAKLLEKEGLTELFNTMLPKPAPQARYSNADVLWAMFYTYLMGGDCLEDVNHARAELSQIKSFNVPSADTVAERLRHWAVADKDVFSGKDGRVRNTYNYAPGPNALLKKVSAMALPKKRGGYRLDSDAHILENDKPDARKAYNHKEGYAPLAGFVGRLPVEVEVRGGNTSPGKDIKEHVPRVIKGLADGGVRITEFCSDAAGYNFGLMKGLHKKRVRFYIRARQCPAMKSHIGKLGEWHPVTDKENNLLFEWAETEWKGYRLVVQREKKADAQSEVFSGTAHMYRAIITNDRRKRSDGRFIIRYYNKRGGIERNFDTLGNDFNWKKMPFDNMAENTVYLLVTALFHALFERAKQLIAEKTSLLGSAAIRTKAFLLRFAAVPARWVTTARQTFLKLYTDRDYSSLLVPR